MCIRDRLGILHIAHQQENGKHRHRQKAHHSEGSHLARLPHLNLRAREGVPPHPLPGPGLGAALKLLLPAGDTDGGTVVDLSLIHI